MAKLQIKKSNETGKVPQPSDLDWGELALNYTDGKLFYKKHGTNTVELLTSVTRLRGTTSGTYTSGDLTLVAGTNITVTQSGSEYTIASAGGADSTKLPLAGGTLTGTLNFNSADQSAILQHDGTATAWYGRLLVKNATADISSFLGNYNSKAGVFAHNNALTAWAPLYVNTLGNNGGGTVYLPHNATYTLSGDNTAYAILNAGNYNSYAPTLTGTGASGTWGISVTGSAASAASATTVSRGSGNIANVTAPGSGTYNQHVLYATNAEFGIEAALATDSLAGTRLPLVFSWRGGYDTLGGLKITGASSAQLGGNAILHAGNYNSYALPLTGGTLTGALSVALDASIYGITVGRGAGAVATNTAVGASALAANTTGATNAAFGTSALAANTSAANNTAVGAYSLLAATTGGSNSALGTGSLERTTTGAYNVAVGVQALTYNTTASNNTAVGYRAGYSNNAAAYSVYVGVEAGYTSNAERNTIVGAYAGQLVTGANNTLIGQDAGAVLTTGAKNTIIGRYNGNQGGLDIRTASNYIVLSDGDGNPRIVVDGSGNTSLANLTASAISASNITITGELRGPATMYIDPAAVGDNTGTLVIRGNLQVDGTTTTINSTTVAIDDLNIQLAADAPNAAAANGAGISVAGASATFTYTSANDSWNLNKKTKIGSESNNNGTALTIANGPYNQVNITHGASTSWGLLLGFGDGSIVGGYHGTNHAAIINVQDAPLHLGTNNDAKFSILGNGNTGIGTTSPESIFHISTTSSSLLRLTRSSNVVGIELAGGASGGWGLFDYARSAYDIWMINGNVGIGTTDPGTRLDINGNVRSRDGGFILSTGTTQQGGLFMYNRISGSGTDYSSTIFAEAGLGIYFAVNGSANRAMVLNSSANLGIGTTNPGTRLDVYGAGNALRLRDGNDYISTTNNQILLSYSSTASYTHAIKTRHHSNDYVNAIDFYVWKYGTDAAGTTGTQHVMTLTQGNLGSNLNGAVGIGTTNPGRRLVVASTGTNNYEMQVGTGAVGQSATLDVIANHDSIGLQVWDDNNLSTPRFIVQRAGNVGINTASPTYKLDVSGTLRVMTGGTTYDSNLLFGNSQGNWASGIRTYDNSDAEMRIWHENIRGQIVLATGYVGRDATTMPTDGLFIVGDPTASPSLKVGVGYTAANLRGGAAKFAVNGIVGVGVANPSSGDKVEIVGALRIHTGNNWDAIKIYTDGANGYIQGLGDETGLRIRSEYGNILLADNRGNVGIGTASPSWLLTAYASSVPQFALQNATRSFILTNNSGDNLLSFNYSGANRLQFDTTNQWINSGNLGIGFSPGTNPSEKLEVSGNILVFGSGSNSAGSGTNIWLGPANNSRDIGIRRAGTAIMAFDRYNGGWYENARFHASGNFSIGNATDNGYKLEVNGSFAATTKSFVIDHPTKPGKKLRYGSLEGPENGVYVRGRLRGTKIELPDYWTKLVDPDSITVQLTPHGRRQDVWVTKIENNCVYVSGTTQPDCYYFIQAERVDVAKLEVEID